MPGPAASSRFPGQPGTSHTQDWVSFSVLNLYIKWRNDEDLYLRSWREILCCNLGRNVVIFYCVGRKACPVWSIHFVLRKVCLQNISYLEEWVVVSGRNTQVSTQSWRAAILTLPVHPHTWGSVQNLIRSDLNSSQHQLSVWPGPSE